MWLWRLDWGKVLEGQVMEERGVVELQAVLIAAAMVDGRAFWVEQSGVWIWKGIFLVHCEVQ